MINVIHSDIRWLIEVNVQLADEFSDLFVSYMPGFGKNTFAKKKELNDLAQNVITV